ncbi:MAG: hypothetical protein IKA99_07560 [Clostridia bacterium]|nr:hypothetical protein [Clostridia bacterium]
MNNLLAATTLNGSLSGIVSKISELMNSFWIYIILAMAAVVVVWGAYIGIKIMLAHKNEEKINARGMVKNLIIGVVIMFVIAMGAPLLINGLAAWIGTDLPATSASALLM